MDKLKIFSWLQVSCMSDVIGNSQHIAFSRISNNIRVIMNSESIPLYQQRGEPVLNDDPNRRAVLYLWVSDECSLMTPLLCHENNSSSKDLLGDPFLMFIDGIQGHASYFK
ncbi:hypothetical protein TNCT_177551 [Trichonephila clavata]|uniref:Uncharacterized protein n=1 Tax=Trichonephila clavata TaxID=2740835 RepID=A0A8X6H1Z9_TRICU|nr:hypothetical protein TNCT_177551 [Trichonephila clavata]